MEPAIIIYNVVRGAGLPTSLSSFIVAQARLETANFTSNVFRKCNNAFGYKAVGTAPKCTGSTEGDYYRQYATVEDSAKEIVGWIRRRQNEGKFPNDLTSIVTPEQYATLLKQSGFYGSPERDYASGLRRYWQQYKNLTGGSGLAIVALVALLWIIRK
jgi:uncharacterized FlgJ-related protein